jgi:hypothetical protein
MSCKRGPVIKRNQQISFQQWTDKGHVYCRASIPVGVCGSCGAKSWDEAADEIIEEAFRREYERLP